MTATAGSVWVGCSTGQVVEVNAVSLKLVRRFPFQSLPRQRLQPLTGGAPPRVLGDTIAGIGSLSAAAAAGSRAGADSKAANKLSRGQRARVKAAANGEAAPGTLSATGWDVVTVGSTRDGSMLVVHYGEGSTVVMDLRRGAVVTCAVPHFGSLR